MNLHNENLRFSALRKGWIGALALVFSFALVFSLVSTSFVSTSRAADVVSPVVAPLHRTVNVGGNSSDTTGLAEDTASTAATWNPEWSSEGALESSTHRCDFSGLQNLDFGGIFCSSTSGTVTVSPSANATGTYSGGVLAHTGVPGYSVQAAEVELNLTNSDHCYSEDHCYNDDNEYCRSEDDDDRTNDTRTSFERHGVENSITISSSSTMTRYGGGGSMTADTYTFTRTDGYFYIGGKLHVNANQASGNYSGTFTVTDVCE